MARVLEGWQRGQAPLPVAAKAKALAEQLMTAPVEASVPTVQPSAPVLDDAEMAVIQAAISDPSTKIG